MLDELRRRIEILCRKRCWCGADPPPRESVKGLHGTGVCAICGTAVNWCGERLGWIYGRGDIPTLQRYVREMRWEIERINAQIVEESGGPPAPPELPHLGVLSSKGEPIRLSVADLQERHVETFERLLRAERHLGTVLPRGSALV